jgi:hypothetical protein
MEKMNHSKFGLTANDVSEIDEGISTQDLV